MSQIAPQKVARYDAPHQFEPLLPSSLELEPLLERASDLTRAAASLGSAAMPGANDSLRTLLRAMNSYYTNRIEGEHTRPADIERALLQDFSSQPDIARRQRLAVAHIRTEQYCEQQVDASRAHTDVARDLHSRSALEWLHHELFRQCEPEDLRLADGTSMLPGVLRTRGVAVGRHEAPVASALPLFWRAGRRSTPACAAARRPSSLPRLRTIDWPGCIPFRTATAGWPDCTPICCFMRWA